MILRGQQRADVSVEDEVGLPRSLDRLGHVWIGGVHELSHVATDLLLPVRQSVDVGIDSRIGFVLHVGKCRATGKASGRALRGSAHIAALRIDPNRD